MNNLDIEILNINHNELLRRKEISFQISHLNLGSPNRLEVRDKIAALQTASQEMTFIQTMQPRFGSPGVDGKAIIYEDEEYAKKLVPTFLRIRNMAKEGRSDALKAEKDKKKKKKGKK